MATQKQRTVSSHGIQSTHFTTLSKALSISSTVDVFGKLVEDATVESEAVGVVHPTEASGALHLAQVFGFKDFNGCHSLQRPLLCMMPTPNGPADSCDWDADELVVWKNLSKNWQTIHVQTSHSSLHGTLMALTSVTSSESVMTAAQSIQVITDCIFKTTGSAAPLDFAKSLQNYNLDTQDQVDTLAAFVCSNGSVGVKRFGFSLDIGLFGAITTSSLISDVDSIIRNESKPK